jgi:putative ABC transport system permease protein
MNLAYRDFRHNFTRFALTCVGLSLLLGTVITITGVYQGQVDDALRQVQAAHPDLWVVQANTNGPFAEASRIPGDTREMVARVYGVERAGAVTYQSIQTNLKGTPLRLFIVGYELNRPGGPHDVFSGRGILRSHYEIVVDRSAGLGLGEVVPLGTHGHNFTVVGLTRNELTSTGDPVAYVTLADAQEMQFELSPASARREAARGGPLQTKDTVNAIVATVSPHVDVADVATALSRWKHLSALTAVQQENLVTKFVIEKTRKQMAMFTMLLVIVSGVILSLIIYTLTMDKLRSIATLKLIGAPDRKIVGLVLQQALSLGLVSFFVGLSLVLIGKDYFPRRVVLLPAYVEALFVATIVVCLAASIFGVRAAVKVEAATAMAG